MATATATKKPAAKTAKASTSTAVAVKKTGAVSTMTAEQIREQLRQQAAADTARVAAPSGNAIQVTQDKKFKMPDGTTCEVFEGVIVDFVSTNNFYMGAFDKNNIQPPACFAIGVEVNNKLVPSDNSPEKQSEACSGCPMNEFGSAGNGKACKNGVKLAILPPDATDDTPIWTLNVSPTALKAWGGYVRSVANAFQVPPIGVVTTFSFDEASSWASVRFSDPAPNEDLPTHFARKKEASELLMTEPDVSGYESAAAKGGKKPVRGGARR